MRKKLLLTHIGAVALGIFVGYQIPELFDAYERNQNVRQIEEQIEQSPNDPTNWISLGTLKQWAGDSEGALAAYKKALELDAQNLMTLRQMGSLYLEQCDQASAEKWFQDALDLAKRDYPDEVYESQRLLEFVRGKGKLPCSPATP